LNAKWVKPVSYTHSDIRGALLSVDYHQKPLRTGTPTSLILHHKCENATDTASTINSLYLKWESEENGTIFLFLTWHSRVSDSCIQTEAILQIMSKRG
jgi:hypothetical protein